jgi:catechol 2,3-dioxygenase-like lactoylglutathione lyase family enzyme
MASLGLSCISVSVAAIPEALRFYRDQAGMTLIGEEELGVPELRDLLRLPGLRARSALLNYERQPTRVRLVEFSPASTQTIRRTGADWDYGIYDIAFFVEGLEALYREITAVGGSFINPPISYNPFGQPVKETIFNAAGAVHLAHLEMGPERNDGGWRYKHIADSAQFVTDKEAALRFYHDLLGLEVLAAVDLPRGSLDRLVGLPPGSSASLTFMGKTGAFNAMVAIIQFSARGKTPGSRARPPTLGIYMLSFEVNDLKKTIADATAARWPVLSGPVEIISNLGGRRYSATLEGPSGALVEVFQP